MSIAPAAHPSADAASISTSVNAIPSPDTDLDSRIKKLPQELQDEVLRFMLLASLPVGHKLSWDPELKHFKVSSESGLEEVGTSAALLRRDSTMRKEGRTCKYASPQTCKCSQMWKFVKPASFSTTNIDVVIINSQYKPCIAFQINREIRSDMSRMLYGNTAFVQIGNEYGKGKVHHQVPAIQFWANSLTQQSRGMIEWFVML